ncbi:hypothetical protein A9Q84_00275 [Halobacteriovorax marinus]|uniref:Uncharacterized protein n=1 Tax=Halobacteriovorax marinus TaxID=97084 RepID=A0A1Y5FIX2_9BACT|nr:hypothetical protein A9Q84_00275 [Halobacteriovorax marinus]
MSNRISFTKSLLLHDDDTLRKLFSGVENAFLGFMPEIIVAATVICLITFSDVVGTTKRTITAVVLIALYSSIHFNVCDMAFKYSDKVLGEKISKNKIMRHVIGLKGNKEKLKDHSLGSVLIGTVFGNKNTEVSWLHSIVVFISVAFFIVTRVLYTIVYYSAPIFAYLGFMFGVFPFAEKSLLLGLKTTLWCCVTPFVLTAAFSVVLLTTYKDATIVAGKVVFNGQPEYIVIFITSLFLLGSCWIASMIVKGVGLDGWAGGISQMASMVTIMQGARKLSAIPGAGKSILRATQTGVGGAANSIYSANGIGPSSSSLATFGAAKNGNGLFSNFSKGIKDSKSSSALSQVNEGYRSALNGYQEQKGAKNNIQADISSQKQNLSKMDRVVLGADSIMNFGKNNKSFKSAVQGASSPHLSNSEAISHRPYHQSQSFRQPLIKQGSGRTDWKPYRSNGNIRRSNPAFSKYKSPELPEDFN